MMNRVAVLCLSFLLIPTAQAGFTETAPADTFIVDTSISFSMLRNRYDDFGNKVTLIDSIDRYEPGGGLQGTLTPRAEVNFLVSITQLQYGILDNLTVALGIPVIIHTDIDVDLQWTSGDYQPSLGRSYSEADFWDWAGSLGQPKPGDWRGNQGTLGDLVLGARWRFSDHIDVFADNDLSMALLVMGALPTGTQAPAEEIVAAGTTMWDLHSQGELGFHLSLDKAFGGPLEGWLSLGLDVFYEAFFRHSYITPTGSTHPLLLSYASYVGETYTLDPGDFAGLAMQLDGVLWRGPALGTWLTQGDVAKAESFPPILSLALRYTYTWVGQSDWESDSPIWDWGREKLWLPGYKNTLWARLTVSLLRVGVPVQLYVAYRNQTWLAGRNVRAADVISGGLQIPARFW